ncbi:hypothetical protein AJ78_03456 [Emergomyces pasteurianus Ep9510]|uniref:Uncharacterized protein n=1 Tax=Emergomyces pasteurianus Ep9510 TaxID=1447872 RepID=A0A1J9QMA9_9EURO|nr:hypothetical protein AJ78_03456 [Emergomyces pasteurianus Ep9510]
MFGMDNQTGTFSLTNSWQWDLESASGDTYRIQISWPLGWSNRRPPVGRRVPVVYAVDGNAMFLTATEVVRRRAHSPNNSGGGIVVAVGYPLTRGVYEMKKRAFDLTPPGGADTDGFGGASAFLDFIAGVVRPFIQSTVFPGVEIDREAIFGHSYGGLFVLHSLFTRPQLFDCFIAASPSIYWNDRYILQEEREFRDTPSGESKATLMIFFGSYEQNPPRWPDESSEHYRKRNRSARDRGMADGAISMKERLLSSGKLQAVTLKEFPEEDHGSVVACALSRGLTSFLEGWPLTQSLGEAAEGE